MSVAERLHPAVPRPFAGVGQVGIAVQINRDMKHVGVLFRRTRGNVGELQLLDLAGHHDVTCSAPSTDYTWTHVDIDPTRQLLVAQQCELIEEEYVRGHAANRGKIGYAFYYRGEAFDPVKGIFVTSNGYGLTCATFVLAVFKSLEIELLDISSWQPRAADEQWQRDVVAYMKRKCIDPSHVAFIEREIGCCRFRPEEVAAAGTVNAESLPMGFHDAVSRGEAIVAALFRRATPAA